VKSRALGALLAAATASACASTNPVPAFRDVERELQGRGVPAVRWARTAPEQTEIDRSVDALLQAPLSPDDAVKVALFNNAALQASYEELGVSQADLAQAARIPNPSFAGHIRWIGGDLDADSSYELSIVEDFMGLLLQPARKRLAAVQLAQTKLRLTGEALQLASEVRSAYYTMQGHQQLVNALRVIAEITATAADFAERQRRAGTIGELDLINQQAQHNESRAELAAAEAEARADRERLNRLLGVWGTRTRWTLPERLPPLPAAEPPLEDLEARAVAQRPDIGAARLQVELIGRALSLKRGTRLLPGEVELGVGVESEAEGGGRLIGPELHLQLPLFDAGGAGIAKLEAQHRQAQRLLEALAVNARSQVREARDRLLADRELALFHARVLVPQRTRILELTLQQYNAMFKGAYDLLLAKQLEVRTQRAYIEAWRDYWIARAELERAVGGAIPAAAAAQEN
jgi:cobalt-zinc-cadmium efflux system outer membrane protein